ncbi:unnamed protein product [Onchocerca flexuosa]|uniref:Uncharacterized protein n=1 Tax=Onchocerca flexuosa TaxID=387005 RepID=A0A183HMI7_9BILA|nr:unnamed protein product [Onchocerca flexuosa]
MLFDESIPNKSELNVSDEIICLQDLKEIDESGPFSTMPAQQQATKELQSEVIKIFST